ncbi:MAG: hypothetical protein MZV65_28965, partial [Chromatiales bacterium]|nr:hypothetical protein [Chromatiales bacterium]
MEFATVHGNDAIMEAAAWEKGNLKIPAVTVLTSLIAVISLTSEVLPAMYRNWFSRVRKGAFALGCDGVTLLVLSIPFVVGSFNLSNTKIESAA